MIIIEVISRGKYIISRLYAIEIFINYNNKKENKSNIFFRNNHLFELEYDCIYLNYR